MAYIKQTYQPGDVLTAKKVNEIQDAIITNQGNIEGHIESRENPHAVTAAQVGAVPVVANVTTAKTNLDNYKTPGAWFFTSGYTPINIPSGTNGWLIVQTRSANDSTFVKQIWLRAGTIDSNDHMTYVRTCINEVWSAWHRYITDLDTASAVNDSLMWNEGYINPPFKEGVEYLTTERYGGVPVYAKRVDYMNTADIGSTNGVSEVAIPHGITGLFRTIRCDATKGTSFVFPYMNTNGGMTVVRGVSNTDILLRTENTVWAANESTWHFTLYYTKE